MINLNYKENGGKHKLQQHMDSLTLMTLKRASEQISFIAGISIQIHATYEATYFTLIHHQYLLRQINKQHLGV